jgi:hypothetical protein
MLKIADEISVNSQKKAISGLFRVDFFKTGPGRMRVYSLEFYT